MPRERARGEHRVALSPAAAGSLAARGLSVVVEAGAGELAGFTDDAYARAGAEVVPSEITVMGADLVVVVGPPPTAQLALLASGAVVVGFLEPFTSGDRIRQLAERDTTALAFEAVPRVTAAQDADALSSQATAAGYAAVLEAATVSSKLFPMLTTAAGTIAPAKVVVLGAGVAGLQAIATARRLGARVWAYDVRPEVAEQIQSLGATAIVDDAMGADGSALADGGPDRQQALLEPHVVGADVVIATAAVPGRPAPVLITHEMVHQMQPGSVIVDLAAPWGGNCEVTYADETRAHANGVVVSGHTNLAGRVARDASLMYARNVLALLQRIVPGSTPVIDLEDEVVGTACVVHRGEVRHPRSRELLGIPASTATLAETLPDDGGGPWPRSW